MAEEERNVARVEVLANAGAWPDGKDGDEPTGDAILPAHYANCSVQPLLWNAQRGPS